MISDWRVQFQSTLAKDFLSPDGKIFKKGTEMFISCECQWEKNIFVSLPMPSPIAMYLNLSNTQHEKALNLKSNLKLDKGHNSLTNSFDLVTDYIEAYFASVIFSVTALESFCNLQIPNDMVYKKKNNRFTEVYNKEQIERWVSLEDKLTIILPKAYNVKINKSSKAWHNLKNLLKFRNRIIHIKDVDRSNSSVKDDSIWNMVLKKQILNPYISAKGIMKLYYNKNNPEPDWLKKSP